MNRHTLLAAAAAMALWGAGQAGCDREDQEAAKRNVQNAADKTAEVAKDAADKTKELAKDAKEDIKDAVKDNDAQPAGARDGNATEEIHNVLAQVAQAALTKNGMENVVERLVDADRTRLRQGGKPENGAELDGLLDQIGKDWKAKYGDGFDIADEALVFKADTFSIRQGEQGKGAAGTEVEVDREADGDVKVEVDRKSGVDEPGSAAADANRNDPGRNIATLSVKESHGLPALDVPLIHEAGGWKIDVPDTLTAEKLRANLTAHLTAAAQAKDQWPGNPAEAQAAVTHHVLMALFDKPAK